MEYVRSMIGTFCVDADDVEARSMLAFTLAIGHHFIAAGHEGRSRNEVLEQATARILG
jgi:hypothetical protein